MSRVIRIKGKKVRMSKLNWNRVGFFVAGTFLGGYVFGFIGALFGRKG